METILGQKSDTPGWYVILQFEVRFRNGLENLIKIRLEFYWEKV